MTSTPRVSAAHPASFANKEPKLPKELLRRQQVQTRAQKAQKFVLCFAKVYLAVLLVVREVAAVVVLAAAAVAGCVAGSVAGLLIGLFSVAVFFALFSLFSWIFS
jgi:hypothetical protein